ncbi:MAG: methylcrotonoyl-CoA carboxylase, partial [Woeseiaceae bacterium]
MPVIKTKVERSSEDFKKNAESHLALLDNLREIDAYVMKGGTERSREKHLSRGKLLPRDRVRALLDEDSEFLE